MSKNVASEKLVSVIIPCYNAEPFVGETIASVQDQSWTRLEIIVVDDGSTDNSWNVIRSFGEKVTAIRQRNGGGCRARNVGAAKAKGEYLMFLDADDLLGPDSMEHLVTALEGKKGIAACSWRRFEKSTKGWVRLPSGLPADPPEGDPLLGWLVGWYIPPCALLWARHTYEETGGWDEELWANQDGDLILRALLGGAKIQRTNRGEAYYRNHGTARVSVSSNLGSVRAFRSRVRVLEKVTVRITELGCLDKYRIPLGQAYHKLARNNFETDTALARECLKRSRIYAGHKAVIGSLAHRVLCMLLGVERKEFLATLFGQKIFANRYRKVSHKLFRSGGV
ncbi:MAG: hypothetical protein CVU57_13500 [Deltaproteobacteria bacterium HGW-Deltaproteobacteria-15]|jgi:glycosyltransferase involved in cell wall biosynthesis|nr:MAG: hypothetical protein CVU57_13500 [Deltaproteobacteria bacterium HGW-Deltaproteobacteria-15]